jgi:hypothetical protein
MIDKKKQGKANRRKGWRIENEVVHEFNNNDIPAKRTAHPGVKGDVTIALDKPRKAEIKYRKKISDSLWDWQEGVDFTIFRKPRKEFLVQMTLDTFFELFGELGDIHKNKKNQIRRKR